jgi:hypothetical protein
MRPEAARRLYGSFGRGRGDSPRLEAPLTVELTGTSEVL